MISKEELDQARAQRDADQAQVNQLAADLETAKLGGREDAIRAAQAAVASQTAALDKAKWSFDQKQQFAPTNAFVHDTLYRQGEWVAAGNPVVVLLPPANIKVRFFVPETALAQIKTGQSVQVSFDGAAKKYSATVNYISTQNEFTPPVIYNRENRAKLVYMIEAKFSPADAADLRPGQPVDVKLGNENGIQNNCLLWSGLHFRWAVSALFFRLMAWIENRAGNFRHDVSWIHSGFLVCICRLMAWFPVWAMRKQFQISQG